MPYKNLEQRKDYKHQYYLSHRAESKEGTDRWRLAHPEKIREANKHYRLTYPEKKRVIDKRYALAHPEKAKERNRRWRVANPAKARENNKYWDLANPEQRNAIGKKHNFKRRALGFVPLNAFFLGSDGHHVNPNEVIFIPAKLHNSVRHNIWTGKNMDAINALAYEWLAREAQNADSSQSCSN